MLTETEPTIGYRGVILKLYPTKEQEVLFRKNCGCTRKIWNTALDFRIKLYEETGESVSAYTLMKRLPFLKEKHPWLAEVDAKSLQQVLLDLDKAYKNFFRRVKEGNIAPGFPRFKKKGEKDSFRVPQGVFLEGKRLKVSKHGWIRVRGSLEFLKGKEIKSVTVSLRAGKWYASCLVEFPLTTPHTHPLPKVGIDVGVANVVTLAYFDKEGELQHRVLGEEFKEQLEKKEKRRKHYQRILARCQKGSKNREKAKLHVQKAYDAEANCRKEFQEQTSHKLATTFKEIKAEDLNLKGMTKQVKPTEDGSNRTGVSAKSGLNRELLRLGLGRLVQRTIQKSAYLGGVVILVDPKYTSQCCSSCKHTSKANRKNQAEFKCIECGFETNADWNAATNILFKEQTKLEEEVDIEPSPWFCTSLEPERYSKSTLNIP
jgi:putative transposase